MGGRRWMQRAISHLRRSSLNEKSRGGMRRGEVCGKLACLKRKKWSAERAACGESGSKISIVRVRMWIPSFRHNSRR